VLFDTINNKLEDIEYDVFLLIDCAQLIKFFATKKKRDRKFKNNKF